MLFLGVWFNLLLANFNLIPIPPLDGSHVLYHLLPPEIRSKYRELSRYGILILMAMLLFYRQLLFVLLFPAIYALDWAAAIVRPLSIASVGIF